MTEKERSQLTPAQWTVLTRLSLGECDQEIAGVLGLSVRTVHHHLAAIYRRLTLNGTGSPRTAAAAWYLTSGQALREQEAG